MFSLNNSFNRWLSVVFAALFLVFATPTPISESMPAESSRTTMIQGMEYLSHPATVRKASSSAESMRYAAYLAVLFGLLGTLAAKLSGRGQAEPRASISFRPLIARRLLRLLLFPIRYTSRFV